MLVVGDDKQLSPVITGNYPPEFQESVGSIYDYLKDNIPVIMLRDTWRFPDKIATFPKETYYNNQLDSQVPPDRMIQLHANTQAQVSSQVWTIVNPVHQTVLITYNTGILRAQDK